MKDITILMVGGAGYIGTHDARSVKSSNSPVKSQGTPFLQKRHTDDPAILVADAQKAKQLLDWRPAHENLKTIIETAWRWHRNEAR